MKTLLTITFLCALITSCGVDETKLAVNTANKNSTDEVFAELRELTDNEYPDNPDISIRHEKCISSVMESISFQENGDLYNIVVYPTNSDDDTVHMNNIQLMEFIPSVPNCAKGNQYMSLISVVNQEWNRNQVKWTGEDLEGILPSKYTVNEEVISRIDLARNCLNSYLWELFFYTKVDGKDQVYYHGWFDFPKELYKALFQKRNDDSFDNYASYMEHWKDPENEYLDLNLIRQIQSEHTVAFINHDDEMYPLKGERKKKKIAIIYPETYSNMSDFHTDSALFATFSEPGFYNRSDPRTTELGRFFKIKEVDYRKTESSKGELFDELKLVFERENGVITQFVFGGLEFSSLPQLSAEECNSANAYSMGIGNHPFYEDSRSHDKLSSVENPYFGVLLDSNGNWLDSHKIGIDGPLLHLDNENPNILHVWLLSFERHALVGHYEINLSKTTSRPTS